MFCFTVFLVLKLSSALFFLCFLFYTSKDDEVVGAVYIVWEANSRTRTSAIPGQAPPLQLLPQRFFENLQIFLQLQTNTTSLTSTATARMSNCPDARSK